MGIGFGSRCSTNYVSASVPAPAPNPDPSRWVLIDKVLYANAYVLKVKYLDCTNFEGIKIMVYSGQYSASHKDRDPHFCNSPFSPIARFKPTLQGWALACQLAKAL